MLYVIDEVNAHNHDENTCAYIKKERMRSLTVAWDEIITETSWVVSHWGSIRKRVVSEKGCS